VAYCWRVRGSRAALVVHGVAVLVGIALITALRAPLVERHGAGGAGDDVSLLLSPEHMIVLSLGHREALADYLFANALVKYGLSFEEKRRFESAYRYLDTITTLAPTFDRPYLYVDTLLTMRVALPTLEDYLDARRLHERGLAALPSHSEVWSVAGQYAAYLAPPHIPEPHRSEFKQAGARILAHACELASNNENIPYHCITAARLFDRAGQREAMVRMLTRTLAVNDDPELRERAFAYLARAEGDRLRERFARRDAALEAEWRASLPHASRNLVSLLGPRPDVWRCAGTAAARSERCHSSWRDWGDALDRAD
jgi:tetratricopeptide (TPR) repeat protein